MTASPVPSAAVDPWAVTSAIGTGAAGVVAIIAAALAFWQARIAIGARNATVEQAAVAREALDLQRAQQHQADAPTFALSIEPPQRDQPCWVKVTMTGRPPGVSVGISYVNGWIRQISPTEAQRQETQGDTTVRRNMIKNSSAVFEHDAPRRRVRNLIIGDHQVSRGRSRRSHLGACRASRLESTRRPAA